MANFVVPMLQTQISLSMMLTTKVDRDRIHRSVMSNTRLSFNFDKLDHLHYQRPLSGDVFVNAKIWKEILPMIVEELSAARKQAKYVTSRAADPMIKAVQDGRQLALEISVNFVMDLLDRCCSASLHSNCFQLNSLWTSVSCNTWRCV